MNKTVEKGILLSLSLILITNYSISAALPQMQQFYAGMPTDRVDLLISVPSFGILVTILLNIFLGKYIRQSHMISFGLLLFTAAGLSPLFCQAYPFLLCARFLQGLGSGMVNIHAVTVLSERYTGQELTRMMGLRGSFEALGSAVLTFVAGFLLPFGWTHAFLIYATGILILALYLWLLSRQQKSTANGINPTAAKTEAPSRFTGRMLLVCVGNALLCTVIICSNTTINMRLASLVVENGLGTDTMASTILSGMVICTVILGLIYDKLKRLFGQWYIPFTLGVSAVFMLLTSLSTSLITLTASALTFGLFYSGIVSCAFQNIAEQLPLDMVNRGTSIVLIGGNFGAFITTYVIKFAGQFSPRVEAPLLLLSGILLLVAIAACLFTTWRPGKAKA